MIAAGVVGLMERELETAHIQRAVDHSWHGVGRLVVIEGPAGIGKTTPIGAAREVARDAGMNARVARAAELEQSFAFGSCASCSIPCWPPRPTLSGPNG
jgi:AAA domain